MNTTNRSVLRFHNYIVKEVLYHMNEEFNGDSNIELDFSFDNDIKVEDNGRRMEVELTAHIFKEAYKNNYPFEMKVSLKGFFEIDSLQTDVRVFESNALAILFPYIRALVSTYTANANLAPVILPAMNINAFLKKKYGRVSE